MTASLEEYLKTIYILKNKNGTSRVTDIATELNISKPSVNRALRVLTDENIIKYEAYGDIVLTKFGEETARKIVRSQLAIESFLTDILKVENDVAIKEATIMRHAVSEDTVEKLEEYIKTFIDIEEKECNLYNPNSRKCKICQMGNKQKIKLTNNKYRNSVVNNND